MSESIKVVLLCGGIGKRLFPISTDKSLLNFFGQALIVSQIKTALASGLNHFVIVTNPQNNSALKSLAAQIKRIEAEFVIQHEAKGMADALSSALTLIRNEPFILLSADDIFEPSLFSSLLEEYNRNSGYDSYITAYIVKNYFPGGYLVTDNKHKIKKIVEKPAAGQEPSDLVNIVCHLHTKPRKLLKYLETIKSKFDDVYEKSLTAMISDNYKMKAVPYDGVWQTIKYPWHIHEFLDILVS